jgi:hypothetical protein
LSAVAEEMIGENNGEHGFADGNGANADARIMPALRRNIGVLPLHVDGLAFGENGGCGLHGEARDDFLPCGDTA